MLNLAWTTQTEHSNNYPNTQKKESFNNYNNFKDMSLLCTTYTLYGPIIEKRLKQKILKNTKQSFEETGLDICNKTNYIKDNIN